MKLLYCSHCNSVKSLSPSLKVITNCDCGKCKGVYVERYTGRAIFTEMNTAKPKYLWVLGITNDFLGDNKPNYKVWEKYKTHSLQFNKNKSVIIKLRPSINGFEDSDIIFLNKSIFEILYEEICHDSGDKTPTNKIRKVRK